MITLQTRGLLYSFYLTSLNAVLAYGIASLYFPSQLEMAVSGFIALGLVSHFTDLLEANRKSIWEKEENPWQANILLATHLLFVFLGILSIGLLYQALFIESSKAFITYLPGHYQNEFSELLTTNAQVFLNSFLLAFLFRSGGLILVFGWNAVHWSNSLVQMGNAIYLSDGTSKLILFLLAILPHLLLEVCGYTLAGLAGTFWSKATSRYSIRSKELQRVMIACITLLMIGIGLVIIGGFIETQIAQHFVENLKEQ